MSHLYENTESIRTYLRLLDGEIRKFPPVFFSPHVRKNRIINLMNYLIEEILNITPEEAYETITKETLKAHQLDCLLRYVEDFPEKTEERAVKKLIHQAYPHLPEESLEDLVLSIYKEVLSGTRRNFPSNYFAGRIGEERAAICVEYLVDEILQVPQEDISKTITREVLSEYKLRILLNLYYDSPFDLLTSVYPHLTSKDFS